MTEYYFNTTTGEVEEGRQSPGVQLMGPYASREEASRALEIAEARNKAWDDEDEAWNDKEPEGDA